MKTYLLYTMTCVVLTASGGCGDELINEMNEFVPNNAPEITAFNTDIADGTELLPNMMINLAVSAHDPEGGEVQYSYTSPYGTFRRLEQTATGSTIECFINYNCPTSLSVPITVNASDSKGASSSRTIDIGDGRSGPAVSGTWPGSTTLNSGDSVSVTFSADCTGVYQTRIQSPPDTEIVYDKNLASYGYNERNKSVTLTIKAGTGSDINLSGGTHKVYILLYDYFGRQGSTSATFTVN